ncbi:hypothetical protein SBV1_2490009 [Verrucomicrobia bacterium]|nr:hypothetical protein SBV1_2490009 [Verrucomicrobiota bacterium]
MALGSESGSVQRPLVRYAVEAGWTYLSPSEALLLRAGGVASPVLDAVMVRQLQKLNPGIVDQTRAQDIVIKCLVGPLDASVLLRRRTA